MGNKKEQSLIIANRYRIIEELGKGSMGIVYKVQDTFRSNEFKALKTIKKEIINFEVLSYFKKEFEIMNRLRHPNLVQVFDFGYENSQDFYYLTLEYVNGKTLKELLKQEQKTDEKKVLNIIVSLYRTIGFIHSRSILHRDIKPSNILIKGDKIKITDFGLSDLGNEEHKHKGSLLYAAPEILSGKADNRSDIFSTGLIFFELIIRKNFYNEKSTSDIAEILRNDDKFTNYKNNAIKAIENTEIQEIISIMLDFFPENRFQHCSEIIHSINANLKKNFALETTKTRESYVLGAGFVGRKEELTNLKEYLEINNNNKVLIVKGKAGIGKSRLFMEFRKYCQLQGIEFLEANCSEKIAKTYAPFIDILNDTLPNASKELIEKYGQELKKILPAQKVFSKTKANPVQDPKTERGILIQNITNFLLEYSKQQSSKIAIYLNDLHWTDEASLEVLQELMYKISTTENEKDSIVNLFVFSSLREEEIDKIETTLAKLRNKKRLEEIELHPFDTKDVKNYIEAIFGENYIADSLLIEIPEIGRKVGGNPFFLQQLMKSLIEKRLIKRKILKWELSKPIKEIEIPKNLKEIIKKSIENLRLSNKEKKTLQYFALLNKLINTEEFQQILPKEIDINLKDFFINLENKEIITSSQTFNEEEKIGLSITEPHPNLLLKKGEGIIRNKPILEKQQNIKITKSQYQISNFKFLSYSFTHSLIREVIEEEIKEKQELHLHIAQRLEKIYKENIDGYLDELVNHYSQTDDKEKTIHYLEKAGDKAKKNYENEKAISYYDKLLKNLQGLPNLANLKIDILLKKGNIIKFLGKWDEAQRVFQKAINLSVRVYDEYLIAKSKINLGHALTNKCDYHNAFKLENEALKIFTKIGDSNYISETLNAIGNIYNMQGNYTQAIEFYNKSFKIAKKIDNKRKMGIILNNLGMLYAEKGDFNESMIYNEKSLKIGEKLADNMIIIRALRNIGNIQSDLGNYKKAMECYQRQLKISLNLGSKTLNLSVLDGMGVIYKKTGNYFNAKICFQKQLKLAEELNSKAKISFANYSLGRLYMSIKKYNKAEKLFNTSVKIFQKLKNKYLLCFIFNDKAELYFILKKFDEAKILCEKSNIIAKEIGNQFVSFYNDLLLLKIEFYHNNDLLKKERQIIKLKKILSKEEGGYANSTLNYELYKMTNQIFMNNKKLTVSDRHKYYLQAKNYKKEAIKLYKEAYKKTPDIEYKERIEEMEKEIINDKLKMINEKKEGERKKENVTQTFLFEKKQTYEVNYSAKYFSEFIDIVLKLNNLNSSELYRKIVDLSIRFIDAERGFLLLYDEQGELQVEVAREKSGEEIGDRNEEIGKEKVTQTILFEKNLTPNTQHPSPNTQHPTPQHLSQTVINKVIKTGKPLFVPNISEFEEIGKNQSVLNLKLQSVMCIPLGRKSAQNEDDERRKYFPIQSAFLGMLYVDSTKITEKSKFKDENLHLLQAIADQASYVLINALLYEKANIDSLTGLYLRPYFEDRLNSEIQFHKTHNSNFCLLMIDIDFFKNINDSYGHSKGDEVLKKLGCLFKNKFRDSDTCARYGGDEFVVLLANTNKKQAELVAEELLKLVNSSDFSGIILTISIGISEFDKNTKDLSQLLKQADDALYAAKKTGRNRFKIWDKSSSNFKQSHIIDILTGDPIRDYRNVEMLLQSIKESISVLNYYDLLDRIVDTIIEITNSERCLFILINDKENGLPIVKPDSNLLLEKKEKKQYGINQIYKTTLDITLAKNNKGEFLSDKISYSKTLIEEVMKTGIPYCLKDISDEEATQSQIYLNLRSAMCVPLQIKKKLLGVIYVDSQYILQQFSQPELSIFSAVASQLALIIENTRLHEKAIKAEKIKERLLEEEIIDLHKRMKGESEILGKSKAMETVFSQIRKVARTDSSVLLYGETGTGKELIASAIHNASFRHDKSFIIADCGAISAELIEGELFGHEKGSYTGAYEQKKGLLEAAIGGTIFLDEIGELPLHLQPKLLRFLQEKNIRRIGATKRIKVNVRVIAATNKDLKKLVKENKFREDLYYRLNVFSIGLPPLRKRENDVLILADHFLKLYGRTRNIKGFTNEALEMLKTYQWAGNVRELQHKIERAVIMSESEYISVEEFELRKEKIEKLTNVKNTKNILEDYIFLLKKEDLQKAKNISNSNFLEEIKNQLTDKLIKETIKITKGNKIEAAKILGISKSSIYEKTKK
ncbi:MAG: sigma 54-interacting transcriptional regulator [Candidatus Cloacimonetes bacterium]|nr:sigma 54-interacting transcriptional regulator [Candidatus Cloacimonadota bacterium]